MVPPAASPCDRPHPCRFFPFLPSCALPHSWHLHGSHAPVTFESQWMCLESVMRWTRRFACHDIHGRSHSDACCRAWVKYTIDGSYVYCRYLPGSQVGVAGKRRPPQHDDAVAGGGLAEGNLAGRRVSAGVFPLTCLSLDSVSQSVCVCVCVFDSTLLAPTHLPLSLYDIARPVVFPLHAHCRGISLSQSGSRPPRHASVLETAPP